jgi:Domain of unknown function (DUF4352)
MKRALAASIAVLLVGCGGGVAVSTNQPGSTRLTTPPASTADAGVTLTPDEPTDTPPADGPTQAKVGQTIRITCDGTDCLDVVVLKAVSASRYKNPDGYRDLDDVPKKGNIFLAVQIRYTAVGPNADYNEFDWALYVNDEQIQDTANQSDGPQPELSANNLPSGKKVTGWIVWEIPKTGRVTISYEPGQNGSIFEVVLRSK